MKDFSQKIYRSFVGVGLWAALLAKTSWFSFKRPPSWSLILEQLFNIGVLSLPVVAITGFSTGLVLAAQSFYQLGDKGLAVVTGIFVGKSMLTEVGPVLTAFMVMGRVGSAITAVIGTMKVTEQLDALKSMAVNPFRYLVAPRVISGALMMPILTIFSAFMGIYGGYLISVYAFGMTPQGYWEPMSNSISLFDFATGLVKAFFFGLLISSIACYKGLTTSGGASGVGRSITSAVVVAYTYILIINFVLTIGMNALHQAYMENFGT